MALPFKLTRGSRISPGCRYVVVGWDVGKAKVRAVRTCHRTLRNARKRAAELRRGIENIERMRKANPHANIPKQTARLAVYDVKTGRKVSNW